MYKACCFLGMQKAYGTHAMGCTGSESPMKSIIFSVTEETSDVSNFWCRCMVPEGVILLSSLSCLPTELRSLKSTSEWQEALVQARAEAEQNPLPLEVFKVRGRWEGARALLSCVIGQQRWTLRA